MLTPIASAVLPLPGQAGRLTIELLPPEQWHKVAAPWAELASEAQDSSFFLSEAWVRNWLAVYGDIQDTAAVLFRSTRGVEGACLLSRRKQKRAGLPVVRIAINTAGEPEAHAAYMEHNRLLCRPGQEESVASALAGLLRWLPWDELSLDGFDAGASYATLTGHLAGRPGQLRCEPDYFVDLARLRACGRCYMDELGKSVRKHLRQSLRACEELGEVGIEEARDVDTAWTLFDELRNLNLRRRKVVGGMEVLQSDFFRRFHRRLIAECLPTGSVKIWRLRAGETTIGIVYLLIDPGGVRFYQCGYNYEAGRVSSPGNAAVAMTIQRCLESGYREFDFLAGPAEYKQHLSTDCRMTIWAEYYRPGLKNSAVQLLLKVRERLQGRHADVHPPHSRDRHND